MPITEPAKPTRKPTNLSLDSALLQEAKALGVNVSRSAEVGIAEAVRRPKREQWLQANKAARNCKQARFPTDKRLEGFDYRRQTTITNCADLYCGRAKLLPLD